MTIRLQTNTKDPILEFLHIEKYDDQSGFGATVHVESNGFSAEVFCTFENWSMEEFINQLQGMDQIMAGHATLKPQWDNWFITFSLTRNGHVIVGGVLYAAEQELKFQFTTDQTCLSKLISDFEAWRNQ